jgi:hypothetical protein
MAGKSGHWLGQNKANLIIGKTGLIKMMLQLLKEATLIPSGVLTLLEQLM